MFVGTLVPEIRVRPEMFRVFRYIDVLTCVSLQLQNTARTTENSLRRSLRREDYRRRQVGECADRVIHTFF